MMSLPWAPLKPVEPWGTSFGAPNSFKSCNLHGESNGETDQVQPVGMDWNGRIGYLLTSFDPVLTHENLRDFAVKSKRP